MTNNAWSPASWHRMPATQIPDYQDPLAVESVVRELSQLPPLVTSWEVENLKTLLAEAARGETFLLQAGDCSESFADCDDAIITVKLKILLQMSLILTYGCSKRIVRVGRIAGQYAKPRSSPVETRNGITLPSYFGDLVNRLEFTPEARRPDPHNLLKGYHGAALTLNFLRSLMAGGFGDLSHTKAWDLDFMRDSPQAADYQRIVDIITEAMGFMGNITPIELRALGSFGQREIFTSHEGLNLHYEEARTRHVPLRTGWYDLSCHFPWIGERTRDPGGAHVEFFRGVENPIGVKIGPSVSADELLELVEVLDPNQEPGRLTLIHRFGVNAIEDSLPPLIKALKSKGRTVLWCCDPMHGNTITSSSGHKTRRFDDIRSELEAAFDIHSACNSHLGGAHLELTGEPVTECVGGARGLAEEDLSRAYKSHVDPRLNYEQALEMALLISRKMKEMRQ